MYAMLCTLLGNQTSRSMSALAAAAKPAAQGLALPDAGSGDGADSFAAWAATLGGVEHRGRR